MSLGRGSFALLGVLVVTACSGDDAGPSTEVVIPFRAQLGDREASCGTTYDQLGTSGTSFTLGDFRFYVHDLVLLGQDGTRHPVELVEDGKWQGAGVALLDFENGASPCDSGNADLNTEVRGRIAGEAATFTGLELSLGVPFDRNHDNAATAPTPLNLTSMFWSWNAGYKFLRVDGTISATEGYRVHLGSIGCTMGPDNRVIDCTSPNRPRVSLGGFDPTGTPVVADLAAILSGSDLGASVPPAPGCMSDPGDPDCPPIFERLGLAPDGTAAATQSFFRAAE